MADDVEAGVGQIFFVSRNRSFIVAAKMFAQAIFDALVHDVKKPENQGLKLGFDKLSLGAVITIKNISRVDFEDFSNKILKGDRATLVAAKTKLSEKDPIISSVPDSELKSWINRLKRVGVEFRFKWLTFLEFEASRQ